MSYRLWLAGALFGLMAGGPVGADVWDVDSSDDDDNFSDNELTHGSEQVHDLAFDGTIDQDWYRIQTRPFSSYEFVADGFAGSVSSGGVTNPTVDLMDPTGSVVLASGAPFPGAPTAYARTLRWQNSTSTGTENSVRVANPSCGVSCTTSSAYTAKFWETSTSIARFNNSGGQITVLLLQNPASYIITGRIYYWTAGGGLIASQTFSAAPNALVTVSTASVVGPSSGSITITHSGRYGDLQGKSVALEPSTGFSFDTPMVYRPR